MMYIVKIVDDSTQLLQLEGSKSEVRTYVLYAFQPRMVNTSKQIQA